MAAGMCHRRGLEVLHEEDANRQIGVRRLAHNPCISKPLMCKWEEDSNANHKRFPDLVGWNVCFSTSGYTQ